MPPVFPGVKFLTLKHVLKNIGGDVGAATQVKKLRVWIPSDRITGPTPQVWVRASASGTGNFEQVTGDVTVDGGTVHTLASTGAQVDVRVIGSGCTLSARDSNGKLTPAIICKVEETV